MQPGVHAGADRREHLRLGEDLRIRPDADLEILAPHALRDQHLLQAIASAEPGTSFDRSSPTSASLPCGCRRPPPGCRAPAPRSPAPASTRRRSRPPPSPPADRSAPAARAATRWRSRPIAAGEPVRKFGQIIGVAKEAADNDPCRRLGARAQLRRSAATRWHGAFERDYADHFAAREAGDWVHAGRPPSYAYCAGCGAGDLRGLPRANGRVGTRNYIGILTSVNCSATVAALHRRGDRALGHPRRLSQCRRRHPLSTATGCGIDIAARALRHVLKRTSGAMPPTPTWAAC
jgi:hypothetical protein